MTTAEPTHLQYFVNRRFVAFVDILGFTALIRRIRQEETLFPKIVQILREVTSSKPRSEGPSPPDALEIVRATTFSDNIVISTQYGFPGLTIILYATSILCARLLSLGVFARGAIALEKLYHDESIVFGEGLVEAYDLERRVACYPRIVLSSLVDGEITSSMPHLGLKGLRRADVDGVAHLHYLSPTLKPLLLTTPRPDSVTGQMLDRPILDPVGVHNAIGFGLRDERDPGIRSKLVWFARYFNESARGLGLDPFPLELP